MKIGLQENTKNMYKTVIEHNCWENIFQMMNKKKDEIEN